jgi:hypothetical protein
MTTEPTFAEQQLRAQMDAMHADVALKLAQTKWEPWKAIAACVSACGVFGAAGAALFALGQHFH